MITIIGNGVRYAPPPQQHPSDLDGAASPGRPCQYTSDEWRHRI